MIHLFDPAHFTRSEKEVLNYAAQGLNARQTGDAMMLSEYLVHVCRQRLLEKARAKTVSHLVRGNLQMFLTLN